jgi:hypothetical protein
MAPKIPPSRAWLNVPESGNSHSQLMWAETDVIRLFSINLGSFSINLGQSVPIFSANVGQKCGCNQVETFMLSGRYNYATGFLKSSAIRQI